MSTFYQAQVSQEQLKQAQDQSQREIRAQAAHITAWVEVDTHNGVNSLHVMNRSLDPASYVVAYFDVIIESPNKTVYQPALAEILTTPPCSEMVLQQHEIQVDVIGDEYRNLVEDRESLRKASGIYLTELQFVDRNGRYWSRTSEALKEIPPPAVWYFPPQYIQVKGQFPHISRSLQCTDDNAPG
ncbi:hypothetical protein [Streptomyces barringtoniae]|uniref:hypothetical protein n=1 Tax=Streptomyces barringtoniae TaxID=2892029 RepID=UPI001E302B39|nr:hypothetical protein [Streptomyces barringtoniae]MCC5476866.1 hypothetical protein [Streptomyces barringtoniae]